MNQGFFQEGSPRVMFYLGLAAGLAVVLSVNTVMVYGGGNFKLQGAEKPDKVADAAQAAVPAAAAAAAPTPAGGPVPPVRADDHIRGNKNAKVVMIEYSDFQCPYCGAIHPSLVKLMADFPNQIEWVYRHFPLSFHPNAVPAANAAECASEQGKFWEFADKMFANQDSEGDAFYQSTAVALGLNASKFKDCYAAKKYDARIQSNEAEGGAAGVNGTPATFINGQLVSGALPYDSLKQMITSALAQ